MAKVWRYLGIALGTVRSVLAIRFTMLCWDLPWPDPILTIDGKSYLKGAEGATWRTVLAVNDLYHSPGYQIYLRAIFATLGTNGALIEASKLLSLAMFFASAVMLYRLGRRWFQPAVAQIAVGLFLCSQSWIYYCNMIQYEIMTGFLILLFLSLLTSGLSWESSRFWWLNGIAIGFLLAFISLIQMRYLALLIVPLTYTMLVHGKRLPTQDLRRNGIILLTTLVLLAGWSIAQSLSHGRAIFVMDGSQFRFHVSNNPNALGFSFPYPQVAEPSGWQFILSMPGQWLWLIGQRALYLFGIKRDLWALPPDGFGGGPIGSYSALDAISTIVFAAGLLLAIWRLYRGELGDAVKTIMVVLACVILPPLLIFGSKRFIVPVMPLMALFQGYVIATVADAARDHARNPLDRDRLPPEPYK
jgi:hypothetical protein